MRIALIPAFVAVLAFAGPGVSQTGQPIAALQIPDGDGTWTIHINTSGGFTGLGKGSVALTSQGNLKCLQTLRPCVDKLVDDRLRPITQLVLSFDLSKWTSPTLQDNTVCNDCYHTTVTFTRREGGSLKISTLAWNDVTQGRVPPDVLKIVEMALSGKW